MSLSTATKDDASLTARGILSGHDCLLNAHYADKIKKKKC